MAGVVRNALRNFDPKKPSIESTAILNAAKRKAQELNISPEILIKEVIKKVGGDYQDANDAEFMMKDYLTKILSTTSNATQESSQQVIQGGEQGNQLQREGAQEGQPETGQGEGSDGQTAQPKTDNSDSNIEGEGAKEIERGFARRTKTAPEVAPIASELEDNPELMYERQKLADVRDRLSEMSDQEKLDAMTPIGKMAAMQQGDNFGILAGLDLLEIALAEGRLDDATQIYETIAKAGTTLGQLVRQMGELKNSSPDAYVFAIEKELDKFGLKLSDADKKEIYDLATAAISARVAYAQQEKLTMSDPTDANIKRNEEAKERAEKSYVDVVQKVNSLAPSNTWDELGTIVQGNLLTPMSQATNIWSNLLFGLTRAAVKGIVAPVELLSAAINKENPKVVIDPEVKKYYYQGLVQGSRKAWKQLFTGVNVDNLNSLEIQRGFQPFRAAIQAWTGVGLPLNSKGKVDANQRINKAIEATFGLPAEIMFRLLSLGDKPFYFANYNEQLARIGKEQGLSGQDLKNFVMFPPNTAVAKAELEAKKATFQQDSKLANSVQSLMKALDDKPLVGKPISFIIKTQVPYVKTPINIVSETLNYAVPLVSLARVMSAAKRNDKREVLINSGKAFIGTTIILAGTKLVAEGIISGGIGGDEEKEKQLKFNSMPPNSINFSALERFLNGESTEYRAGDDIRNLEKMGIVGSVLGTVANVYSSAEIYKEEDLREKFLSSMLALIPASGSLALDQSFLKGTSTFLDALKSKSYDKWLQSTFNAITSIPLPNTLASINRMNREYMPSLRGDDLPSKLNNVIKAKTFNTDDLPVMRNLWGDEVKQTPEGSNPFLYNMLDVTKGREVPEDPLNEAVYNLYIKTQNSDVIPSQPSRTIIIKGKKQKLTDAQYWDMAGYIGRERRKQAEKIINTPAFKTRADDVKIRLLSAAYVRGAEIGKRAFIKDKF
jgi:hypothetical protein